MNKVEEASLDERMRAAGMVTLADMLSNEPFTKFQIHSGMDNLEFFEDWLERRYKEFAMMRVGYELGDKDKDDGLYEWVFAHCAAFSDVLMQFRAARAALTDGGE